MKVTTMTHPELKGGRSRHFETVDDVKFFNGVPRKGIELESVEKQAEASILALELAAARAAICKSCRENQWYECDAPEGWSPNCAFLKSHQVTGFGELGTL
jgi:hypothetical protein